jgi:DNA-damage-inducible protein J
LALAVADAVRILMTRIAREQALPSAPNAETIAAIEEARRGGLQSYNNAEALLEALNAED